MACDNLPEWFRVGRVDRRPRSGERRQRRGSCRPAGSRGHGKTDGVCVCSCCIRLATRSHGAFTMSHTRLVVVADDLIVRLDLRGLLQALGYQVVGEAGDGRAAISLARQIRPDLSRMEPRLSGPLDGIDTAGVLTGNSSPRPVTDGGQRSRVDLLSGARRRSRLPGHAVQRGSLMPGDRDGLEPRSGVAGPGLGSGRPAHATRGAHARGTGHGPGDKATAQQRASGLQAHSGGKHERAPAPGPYCRGDPACRACNPRPSAGHPGAIGGTSWRQTTPKRRMAERGPLGY